MSTITQQLTVDGIQYELRFDSTATTISAQAFLNGRQASQLFRVRFEIEQQVDADTKVGPGRGAIIVAILQSLTGYVQTQLAQMGNP